MIPTVEVGVVSEMVSKLEREKGGDECPRDAQSQSARFPTSLKAVLEKLHENSLKRELIKTSEGVDFYSNDYLGLARTPVDFEGFQSFTELHRGVVGSTGSRLISGNRDALEDLEHYLSKFHNAEAALLFNSGFEANLALIGSLSGRTTTFLFDEYVHASMREGLLTGFSKNFSFRHNDVEDLRRLLSAPARGDTFVLVESLYSMDGDYAPLAEIAALCAQHNAFLIVDEAHATGVVGREGEGMVQHKGLTSAVFARVHTFGKAIGFRGGCVVGGKELIDFLVNKARPFIYTTAPDLFSIWWTRVLYERMRECDAERSKLKERQEYFINRSATLHDRLSCRRIESNSQVIERGVLRTNSPIQGIQVPGNREVQELEAFMRSAGFLVKAIRSPTVPRGKERIRISLHSFNNEYEIDSLIECMDKFFSK